MVRIQCAGCGMDLANPEAFEKEYSNCRIYCCMCCPDSKARQCQKDKLDKARGRDLLSSLAEF